MAKIPLNSKKRKPGTGKVGKPRKPSDSIPTSLLLERMESLSATEVGNMFGVTPSAVSLWYKHDHCPRNEDRTYSLPKVIAWKFSERDVAGGGNSDSPELEKWRRARRRLSELELSIRQGQLVEVADIEEANVRKVAALKQRLLGLGQKLAPRLAATTDPREVAAGIDEEILDAIAEFAGGVTG